MTVSPAATVITAPPPTSTSVMASSSAAIMTTPSSYPASVPAMSLIPLMTTISEYIPIIAVAIVIITTMGPV